MQARYRELRSRRILTALGEVELTRPWYLCPHCHNGQFPVDRQLDVENLDCSPGVRRMHALVGQEAPFDHGREQMRVLAGLEVTTKAVERTAEAIGDDIAQAEQQRDSTRRPVGSARHCRRADSHSVRADGRHRRAGSEKETEGRKGKTDGQPAHTREAKLGCVFTQTGWDEKGFAIRDPDSTTYTGAIETAEEFGKTALSGSLEARLEPCGKESRHGRWSRVDLESGRTAFPRRGADRRSVSRSPAPVGLGPQTVSQRPGRPEILDEGPSKAPAR